MQTYTIVPAHGSELSDEWVRLGVEDHLAGRLAKAQERYAHALRLDPRNATATQNLAIVFAQSNLLNEALMTIERAEMFDGVLAPIALNRALISLDAERIDEALVYAKKAVAMAAGTNPADLNRARLALAMISTSAGFAADAVPLYNEMLDTDPSDQVAGANSCFVQTLTAATPADLLKQRKRWWEANHYKGPKQPHTNDLFLGLCPNCTGTGQITVDSALAKPCFRCNGQGKALFRPLRVGYVGGDYKAHSAAFIFGRVVLHHSPAVEAYLYSSLPVQPEIDQRTKAFKDAVGNRWRDIHDKTDDDAEKMVREDKIDILVDLAGHTNGGRLSLFTRKPAPVQVTAWGFAHGTGCPEIDYFFADPVALPESERQFYVEKIWDLPSIVTMEPPWYDIKGVSRPPFQRNGYITFGNYCRYEKMSEDCIRCLAEILRRVPESRLEFKDHAYRRPYSIKRIMALMPDIAADRLLFSIATGHSDHLLSYQQCDLSLDPFPHGGGVVLLEQLYMGVPVIALYGTQPGGRTGASVLTALGRPEWVARTPQEYADKAVEWAGRTKELAEARKTLRDEILKSPVVAGYVERVEEAYQKMWSIYCQRQ